MGRTLENRDMAIFQLIACELPGDDAIKTEAKIKRKLRRASLGPYVQSTVNELRALHRDLQLEIGKFQSSQYYRGTPGELAAPDHFDIDRMVRDYSKNYPPVSEAIMYQLINFSVYLYYLR